MRVFLFLLLIPFVSIAQETPEAFGHRIFKAVTEDDRAAFETAIAPKDEFVYFFKQLDRTIPDSLFGPVHDKYVQNAFRGFTLCRETMAELKLDANTIVIDRVETEDRELLLKRTGEPFAATVKMITIFFSCSGKNMAFQISDAITIGSKFYVGNDILQIHWLD